MPCFYVLKRFNKQSQELTKNWQGEGTWALSQMTADPPRARFICRPLTATCQKVALAIAREIEKGGYKPGALQVRRGAAAKAGLNEKPRKPDKPKAGGELEAWFDWYHAMKDQGFHCTLEDIATDTNRSYGSVRQLHAAYAIERGLSGLTGANRDQQKD
jgi:hypothetical protein